MTETEQNYAQIEKEALAIVFGCKKFDHYINGLKIEVATDHKPLETIIKNPLYKAPKRLQRIMLSLSNFDLDVKYVPGKKIVLADALSRDYVKKSDNYESLLEEIWNIQEMQENWQSKNLQFNN